MTCKVFRYGIVLFAAALISRNNYAQEIRDTIVLAPVEISSAKIPAMQSLTLDSLSSLRNNLTGITESLKIYTPVFIKEYSPGGIATVSFRGTGAAHTLVLFDGFPVNPAMSGQADLSALPPYLYDKMTVTSSPESSLMHPSAPGGIISLQTNPNTERRQELSVRAETGSFGNVGGGLKFHKKAGKYLFRTRLYYHQADNDFSYINNSLPERPVEKRLDAGFVKKGLMQEVFRISGGYGLFLKFTAISHFNELPASLLQPGIENNEFQRNEIYRLLGGFGRTRKQHFYSVKMHLSSESWTYEKKSDETESQNDILSAALLGDYEYHFKANHQFRIQLFSQIFSAESNNYEERKMISDHRLTFRGYTNLYGFMIKPAVHVLMNNNRGDIAGSLVVNRSFLEERMNTGLSVSRNVRFPGMNDLYWNPGGNPELQPETSLNVSLNLGLRITKNVSVHSGLNAAVVDNWILWQPTSVSTVWSPVNVRKVLTQSVDFSGVFEGHFLGIDIISRASYSYCVSRDRSQPGAAEYDRQLIYVPMHMGSHILKIDFQNVFASFDSYYTGKRYTRADNLSYMPSHFHHNLLIGWKVNREKLTWELFAGIYNITGENYQVIAWQPMPRRSFRVGVDVKIF